MIKRAVLWDDAHDAGDSEDEITEKQQQQLERRLLPGAQRGSRAKDSDDSDDESQEEDSDSDPAVPEPEEKPMRGKFQCQLCPDKILINEKHMELHLQSAGHKKNVKRFERAKEMGVEAFEAECAAKAEARATQEAARAAGALSRKEQKNQSYWQRRNQRKKATKEEKKALKKEKAAKRSQVQKGEVKEFKMKSEVTEFGKKPKKSKAEKAKEVAEEVPLKVTSKPKKRMKTTKASRVQSEELEVEQQAKPGQASRKKAKKLKAS